MLITENRWRDLVPGVSAEAQVVNVLGAPLDRAENVRYGAIPGLTMLGSFSLAASVYLKEGQVLLIVIAPTTANGLERKLLAWKTALGQAERSLASHIEKNAHVHLYPARGLALHEVAGQVEVVEIFPAMSLDAYLKHLYVKPTPFTK